MRKLLIGALCLLSLPAEAQNAITQEGTVLQNSPMMFRGNNRARQGAPVGGAVSSQTVTTGDSVVGGRCDYSDPIDAPGGYTRLCLDAKNNKIIYGSTKSPPGSLNIEINGATYPLLITANGNVVGPNVSTVGTVACYNSITGDRIKECPTIFLTDGTATPPSVAQVLDITHAGPGATAHTGPQDHLRVSIGNYPTTGEFAGDSVGNIGSVQGVVGAVVQPANVNAAVSAFFGVAGYSACQAAVGIGGSCTGVSGSAVALGAGGFLAGINGVVTNSSEVSNTKPNSGTNSHLTGAEIDVNLMKLPDGSAPRSNAVGISIVGVSQTQPSTGATDCAGNPCLATAIFINPMGLSPLVPWIDGIRFPAGATTRTAISIGALCQASAQCSAQHFNMEAYSAAGAGNLIQSSIGLTGTGFFSLNAPTGGEVALQVNAVNVVNALATGVLITPPLTATKHYGGSANNSTLSLISTSSGAPSGDQISLDATTTFLGSADGSLPYASFSTTMIDFARPVRFSTSTTGASTLTLNNAPAACTNPIWIGPMQVATPALSNVYLAACR